MLHGFKQWIESLNESRGLDAFLTAADGLSSCVGVVQKNAAGEIKSCAADVKKHAERMYEFLKGKNWTEYFYSRNQTMPKDLYTALSGGGDAKAEKQTLFAATKSAIKTVRDMAQNDKIERAEFIDAMGKINGFLAYVNWLDKQAGK